MPTTITMTGDNKNSISSIAVDFKLLFSLMDVSVIVNFPNK